MHGRSPHATMSDSMSMNLVKLEDLFPFQHSSKGTRFQDTFRIDSPWMLTCMIELLICALRRMGILGGGCGVSLSTLLADVT